MCKLGKTNWKKVRIIFAVIISVLICVANIVLSCIYRSDDGANIFTAVSGWVSGIATIILGVIAVIQNKKYTLDSMKKELKNEINNEKKELALLGNNLIKYSKLTKMLNNVVLIDGKSIEKISLEYKFGVDSLKEELMAASVEIQLYNYAYENMSLLYEKIQEMISFICDRYDFVIDHISNFKLFNSDIEDITKKALSWTKEFAGIRKDAVVELDNKKKLVEDCKTIYALKELQEKWETELNNARAKISKYIDQKLEEKNNKGLEKDIRDVGGSKSE